MFQLWLFLGLYFFKYFTLNVMGCQEACVHLGYVFVSVMFRNNSVKALALAFSLLAHFLRMNYFLFPKYRI